MASIWKRGKVWHCTYRMHGKKRTESLKTKDAKLARDKKKQIEADLERGILARGQVTGLIGYIDEYRDRKMTNYKSLTKANEVWTLRKFISSANKKTLNGINDRDITAYLSSYAESSPITYNNVLGSLSRFFEYAKSKGYLVLNPCGAITRRPVPEKLPHFFTDDEYLRIEVAAKHDPIYPMVVTARYTGLRLRELLYLEWQDFDWARRVVNVLNKMEYGHTVKNYQVREVPVSYELRDKLLDYIKPSGLCFPIPEGRQNAGGPYNVQGPKRFIKRIFKVAGIKTANGKRIGWHEFRHTFASRLAQESTDSFKIQHWMGHKSQSTTEIYLHFAPKYDEDIERLSIEKKRVTANKLLKLPTLLPTVKN